MREILFKAKTKMQIRDYNFGKIDGEWVLGYYYDDIGLHIIKQFELDRGDYINYEIDPETLCEFTGLTDKNGNKIWENDKLLVTYGCDQMDINEVTKEYIVKYEKSGYGSQIGFLNNLPCEGALEVIGNIFDNKELLEE